ncbi:dna repair protein [Ophiostoma piceae UAMH 11346]|uniref:Dna repair protein n=1 Tax=Ophiostoma piceae (strain UAMH 11346) TaxID=1262450 RepID=S3BWL1_OPHP1|nr:dna repair protein [Ophiostoma piceae UAMH 11346]
MDPVNDGIRQRRVDLVRSIEQALSGIDESLATEINAVNALWQSKYDTLLADSVAREKTHDEIHKDLSSQISRLEATLAQGESERQARDESKSRPSAVWAGVAKDHGTDGSGGMANGSVAELRQIHEKLRQRYDTVRGQLNSVVKVAQTRKEQIVGWIKYADSLEAKIQRLEKKRSRPHAASVLLPHTDPATASSTRGTTPSMPPTPVTLEKPRPLHIHTEVEKPMMSASFSSSSSSFLGITASFSDDVVAPEGGSSHKDDDKPEEEPELPVRVSAADNDEQSNEAALESTQGDPSSDGSPPQLPDLGELPGLSQLPMSRATNITATKERHTYVKEEPSSDGLEVMWERPVKRSRTDDRSATPHTPIVPPATKRERDAPKNGSLASIARFRESQESVDLDEGQLTVATPRKRQLYLGQLASERESDGSSNSLHSVPPAPGPPPPAPALPVPLAPVSVNIRRGTMDPLTRMKSLKRGIESVAEDNEGYSTPDGTPRRTAMEPPPSTGKASRLNSLLNSRPAESSPVITGTGRRSPSKRQNQNASDSPLARSFGPAPPPRLLPRLRDANSPFPKTPGAGTSGAAATTHSQASARTGTAVHTPASSKSRPRASHDPLTTPTVNSLTAALNAAKAESAARKAAPPLRGKAMDQLKIDDFKINPAMNNGDTFAYNEVVRGRTDRANLAGCTDPQCCGKVFRGMATSELDAAGQAHVDRPEGIALMERHLGDEACKLTGMGSEDRRVLWVEARTKELADKYGKHRHRYHRRASPPGFWDTDFPTTQEEEYNRAEAEKVERLTVQERYREAMKPSGRWLFRDE